MLRRNLLRAIWPVAGLLLLTRMASSEENWPEYRGPAANGHANASNLPLTWSETENVLWKTFIHGDGWSSPVVWDDQIWLTTATPDGKDMFGICVDRRTGEIIRDFKLFHNDEPEDTREYNSFASCTPLVEEGRVFLHFGSYGTACIDTKTGEPLWTRRDLPCNHWRGPASSPISFGDLLIIHFDGFDYQYVVALNKDTGKTVWKKDRDIDFGTDDGDAKKAYGTPIIIEAAGREQLISPFAKGAKSYDPATGKEYWTIRYNGHSAAARPIFGHGLVFISSGFAKPGIYAVRPDGEGDVTGTHVAWKLEKGVGSKPSLLLVGDLLYMITDKGIANCLNAKTGEEVWQERVDGNFSASPLYADGRIYLFNEGGTTTVLQPGNTFHQLAVNTLDEGCMASPAVTDDSIIVRTMTHLYCLEEEDGAGAE